MNLCVVACGGSTALGPATGKDGGAGTAGTSGGTGGATGAGGATSASAQDACEAAAKARCDRRNACTNGIGDQVRFGDGGVCESRDVPDCLASLTAPGTSQTVDKLTACAAAIATETCSDFLNGMTPAICAAAAGSGANAAPCVFSGQCQSAYCAIPTGGACGTCADAPRAGDSCAVTGTCVPTLSCTTDTASCVVPGGENATCGKGAPCASGLSCVGTAKAANTCKPIGVTVGAACDPKQNTAANCERALGLFCNPTSMKCEMAKLAGPGQPCGAIGSGLTLCTGGANCVTPAGKDAGSCVAPIADDSPCDASKGDACLPPARCVVTPPATTGLCKLDDPTVCK